MQGGVTVMDHSDFVNERDLKPVANEMSRGVGLQAAHPTDSALAIPPPLFP